MSLLILHYLDQYGPEAHLVITRVRQTWGIESKASSSVLLRDGCGLERLAADCGRIFHAGYLLYDGKDIRPLASVDTLAIPLSKLWGL